MVEAVRLPPRSCPMDGKPLAPGAPASFHVRDRLTGQLHPYRLVASHSSTEACNGPWARPAGDCPGCAPLPDGLWLRNGRPVFECNVCGAVTEWEGELDEFELGSPGNVCGGSPRCTP